MVPGEERELVIEKGREEFWMSGGVVVGLTGSK